MYKDIWFEVHKDYGLVYMYPDLSGNGDLSVYEIHGFKDDNSLNMTFLFNLDKDGNIKK